MAIGYNDSLGEYNKTGRRSYTAGVRCGPGFLDVMRNLSGIVLYRKWHG
jgi:hypothetical protein